MDILFDEALCEEPSSIKLEGENDKRSTEYVARDEGKTEAETQ